MSTVTLIKIRLLNFKGIKNLTVDFDANTNIYGDNGSGKTSIFDAFTWLLFGKDSTDRKDFQIKTLDSENNVIPKIDHEVYAELGVNGDIISLKRVFREKWVKQKGAIEAEFSGNETLYYWNEVPLSQKEFQNKVSEILDEQVFKLITSPSAFNALKWQDRRDVLVKIAGDISDSDLAKGNDDYMALVAQLTNKTLDEYKKQIAATIKKAKEDIKTIPTRIDEVERGKPDWVDATAINSEIAFKEKEIEDIDNQISDRSKAFDEVIKKRNANQAEIFELKSKVNTIVFEISEKAKRAVRDFNSKSDEISKQINDKTLNDLKPAENKILRLKSEKLNLEKAISSYEKTIQEKRELWNAENSKIFIFSDDKTLCPCCNRPLDAKTLEDQKNELQNKFNINKKNNLDLINAEGKAISEKKANAAKELQEIENQIKTGENFISNINKEIERLTHEKDLEINSDKNTSESEENIIVRYTNENKELQELKSKIEELEGIEFNLPDPNSNNELRTKKQSINSEIQALRDSLKANDLIKSADNRIEELQREENMLAQSIADIEKTQYIIDNFIKLKVDTIEDRINEKFSFVKFKLFEKQINGALVECCDALINGVPFSDANTASKINAGIDIINTLCEFYKVSAPIFIDNRESVVNLLDSNSQIINLFVSPEDKKLRIS